MENLSTKKWGFLFVLMKIMFLTQLPTVVLFQTFSSLELNTCLVLKETMQCPQVAPASV